MSTEKIEGGLREELDRIIASQESRGDLDRWVWVANAVSGLIIYWGLWLAIFVDRSASSSFDVIASIAGFSVQGYIISIYGVLCLVGIRLRGGYALASSVAIMVFWTYVFLSFVLSNPLTTAMPTYSWLWVLGVYLISSSGSEWLRDRMHE